MRKPNADLTFTFNGEKVSAIPGQTIAAALLQNEISAIRTTRFEGQPRSIFCGIGICFDCVVTVNGITNQRSCLIEATDGMEVTS
jgi:aerobic-type carbon monoxide dehydrogenase small subunit (CoxS/CutS family)